jgi:hypothetical protein
LFVGTLQSRSVSSGAHHLHVPAQGALHKFHNNTVPIGKERIDDEKTTSWFAINKWV